MDMCCHLMNGITSLENDVIDMTHPLGFIAIAFFMIYIYSLNYEIMQLPNTEGTLCVLSNVTT